MLRQLHFYVCIDCEIPCLYGYRDRTAAAEIVRAAPRRRVSKRNRQVVVVARRDMLRSCYRISSDSAYGRGG